MVRFVTKGRKYTKTTEAVVQVHSSYETNKDYSISKKLRAPATRFMTKCSKANQTTHVLTKLSMALSGNAHQRQATRENSSGHTCTHWFAECCTVRRNQPCREQVYQLQYEWDVFEADVLKNTWFWISPKPQTTEVVYHLTFFSLTIMKIGKGTLGPVLMEYPAMFITRKKGAEQLKEILPLCQTPTALFTKPGDTQQAS